VFFQLKDDVTPLKHGNSKVRFVHAGGSVSDAITIKLDKISIHLMPFETVEYRKIPSKEYNIRVTGAENGSTEALGAVCIHNVHGTIIVLNPLVMNE